MRNYVYTFAFGESRREHPSLDWTSLHHHRGRLEDGHGDLCHGELLAVGLLGADHRSIGGQHEVDPQCDAPEV